MVDPYDEAPRPEDVPVSPAATVMLVEDRPDLRVLMVRRTSRLAFAGGMWVFPGGRVDPADDDIRPPDLGLAEGDGADLDVDHPFAFWSAAVREVFEETGLLLAVDDRDDWAEVADPGVDRRALATGRPLADLLAERGWRVPGPRIPYVAQWITPVGPPRRFDARFFVAAAPPHDEVVHDDDELVDAEWVAPATALAWAEDGRWELMGPTHRMLRSLARFESAAEALAVAADPPPFQRARVVFGEAGRYDVLLPGDPGYESGTEDFERGWVRLYRS